jgi:predicted small lipoprotein YifL
MAFRIRFVQPKVSVAVGLKAGAIKLMLTVCSLLALALVSACGQKGPLMLPGPAQSASAPAPAASR